jgi:hypothetical protein
MLILSFDQSLTQTGWAAYRIEGRAGDPSTMVCGSFASTDAATPTAKCRLFGKEVKRLIGRWRPAFIAWEAPKRTVAIYDKKDDPDLLADAPREGRWTVNPKQFLLHRLVGQLEQAAIDYSIPFAEVDARTWRAAVFGIGGGALSRAVAKSTAKITCRRLGIRFANENEAEAALIGVWASTCSEVRLIQHERRAA